ncbi:MotA/TolQ/ExbB proton channel family protein [Comamonas endophytica]|uniref:Biopolymer transport protein ExbB n=1 Tax=Comamonas endophytica TaxID=2949090 RepID=A0ABY6G5X6_9BURK|nr:MULTISPECIES: MotA/TolQ/ExbB proton channel family protein [unclassified Acidovorax]MCD2512242.1 MotA/TolQ/ExbB proton channel family protein [Acidovorax sp. D4N7]UYG50301.1 MotA/TolQ/ExbB proton channel family protein [Acidovorax sp. 5MLIR]
MDRWLWLQQGDAVTQGTATLLLALSVASWVVMACKGWLLARSRRQVPRCVAAFWQAPDLATARSQVAALDGGGLVLPLVDALQAPRASAQGGAPLAQQGAAPAQLTRGLRAALQRASVPLQWGQVLLASVGTLAPFVGLLGTVWGIHHALTLLADAQSIGIAQLAAPVGEALVMTAAGLAVAIPAVLGYNLLGRSASRIEAELEGFAHDLQAFFGDPAQPAP